MALTGRLDITTVTAPPASLLVYNTATANSGSLSVTPGFYYWDGTIWVAFAGAGSKNWALLGNAGTVAGTNFLGTTDAVDLVLKTNNTERLRVLSSGNVGIGTNAPVAKLDVNLTSNITADAIAQFSRTGTGSVGWMATFSGATAGDYNGITQAGDKSIIFSNDNNPLLSANSGLVIAPWVSLGNPNTLISGIKIMENGNVGIGTNTNPQARLHVNGMSSLAGGIQLYNYADYITHFSPGADYYGEFSRLTSVPTSSLNAPNFLFAVVGELNNAATGIAGSRTYGILGCKANNGLGDIVNAGVNAAIEGQAASTEPVLVAGTFNNNNFLSNHWALRAAGRTFQTTGVWTASDRAFKNQITPISNAVASVNKLNFYSYYFNQDHPQAKQLGFPACPEKQFGVIAQELEVVFPDMVSKDGYGNKLVKYEALIPVALKAIQEQQVIIEDLKNQNAEFVKRFEAIEKKMKN